MLIWRKCAFGVTVDPAETPASRSRATAPTSMSWSGATALPTSEEQPVVTKMMGSPRALRPPILYVHVGAALPVGWVGPKPRGVRSSPGLGRWVRSSHVTPPQTTMASGPASEPPSLQARDTKFIQQLQKMKVRTNLTRAVSERVSE